MKIPENIVADLSDVEKKIYRETLAVCRQYPHATEEDWVDGILLYSFESYLRLSIAMDANPDLSDEGRASCFADAHRNPPILPPQLMDIAGRAMRRLTIPDSCKVVAVAETPALFREHKSPLRGPKALLDLLSRGFQSKISKTETAEGVERKRASHCTPQEVFAVEIGASHLSKKESGAPQSNTSGLLFLTLDRHAKFLTGNPVSNPEATIFSQGNTQGGLHSPYGIGRGTWRLTVHFSVFNNTNATVVVYDIRARVYNRLKDQQTLATVAHSMSVELLKDNSILGKHDSINLDPKDSLNVNLALEASLFESPQTTIVFGLLVDSYSVENGSPVKSVLPSDALYVFQHRQQMKTECHFVSRTVDEIKTRMKAEVGNIDVQNICEALLRTFDQHTSQVVNPTNKTQDVEEKPTNSRGKRRSEAAALALESIKCSESGRFDEALEKCQTALAIFREIGDKELECTMLDMIAGVYYASKAFQRTLEYANMELELAREIRNRKHEATALTVAGASQYSLGNHAVAIEMHLEALAIARAENDRSLEALILYNTSLAQHSMGNRNPAISNARTALKLFEDANDPRVAEVRQRLAEWR